MSITQDQDRAVRCAQDYIAAFKRGEQFSPPSKGIIIDGKPDSMALWVLGKELSACESAVRENIVQLLVELGTTSDPLYPEGAEVIRNHQILEILFSSGFVHPDLGREAAIDALRKRTVKGDLDRFGEIILNSVKTLPTAGSLLLIAKAKPKNAKPYIDSLIQTEAWQDVEELKIAAAALGDTSIEKNYLDELAVAEGTQDAKKFCDALVPLSCIGTLRCLTAISKQLRTPLILTLPGAYMKSVRLNVLEALLYNYPEQPLLYPNNIVEEEDYFAAERFCSTTFGVVYSTPPPPFMTYYGFPKPIRK